MTEEKEALSEEFIASRVREFLVNRENGGNWHDDKTRQADLHQKGVDLYLVGGSKNGERFLMECKKQYTGSGKENWLNGLGQIITRISVSSKTDRGHVVPGSYKFGLGLHKDMAAIALRRIPKAAAQILNLYIFSVDDDGFVKKWTPSQFGKKYDLKDFSKN